MVSRRTAAIGYAAAQLCVVIEANFAGLNEDRIAIFSIEFASRLSLAQHH
jgi:hypothetical protein